MAWFKSTVTWAAKRTRADQPKTKYWKLHELQKIKHTYPINMWSVEQLLKCILNHLPMLGGGGPTRHCMLGHLVH